MKRRTWMRGAPALLSMLALAGCWGPEVRRPTTPAGMACAEQCDARRSSCSAQATSQAESEQRSCQSRQHHVERRCSPWVRDKDRQRCETVNAPSCSIGMAGMGACTDTWRRCIVACGGYVE